MYNVKWEQMKYSFVTNLYLNYLWRELNNIHIILPQGLRVLINIQVTRDVYS